MVDQNDIMNQRNGIQDVSLILNVFLFGIWNSSHGFLKILGDYVIFKWQICVIASSIVRRKYSYEFEVVEVLFLAVSLLKAGIGAIFGLRLYGDSMEE
ncbi:hypothetical protein IEQ34_001233 [Dendrobium chrysotoxum]|uniref:Uncharacterized protein n=1 Tax=Dendrobium chrysotoxum TaxID=161865 RepID=A0AAV7HNK0_DENCH|nr:hypothetical protein IEQ34_001233 [Dendrobium chrysotoxum]